jgi:hypothetical protein
MNTSVQVYEGDGIAPENFPDVSVDILIFTDHELAQPYNGKLAMRNSSGDQRMVVKGLINQRQFREVYAEKTDKDGATKIMIEVTVPHLENVIVVPSGNVKVLSVDFGSIGEGRHMELRADQVVTVHVEDL